MSSFDYGPRKLISRGGMPTQTTFNEEELVRANKTTAGSKHRPVARSSTGGPRIPQKRYGTPSSSTSPSAFTAVTVTGRRVSLPGSSTAATGRTSPAAKSDSRYDSGIGLEEAKADRRQQRQQMVPNNQPRFLARGFTDSDDEVETDHVGPTDFNRRSSPSVLMPSAVTDTGSMPFYPSKSAPSVTAVPQQQHQYYRYYPQKQQPAPMAPPEVMDVSTTTTPTVTAAPKFDAEQYQRHLVAIQQRAIEQDRLQQGLSLLVPNNDGDTGLHQAIIHNQPNMVTRLLELISKYPQLKNCVDDQNALYQTPLHLATHLQQTDIIRQLLKAEASPFLQDHKGNTPFHVSCSHINTKCLDELLRQVPPSVVSSAVQVRNYHGQTCLHAAVLSGNKEALLKLRAAGVHVDHQDHCSGKTPLHLATEKGSLQLVQTLIRECKANFDSTTYSGCTPLHIASGHGHMELVAYLISLGADPFAVTDEGDTPHSLSVQENVRHFLASVTDLYYN